MAEMTIVDNSLSMYNPTSILSSLNSGKGFRVGPYFSDVFRVSQRVHAMSGGAFDPTIAPLTEVWGFGPGGDGSTPSEPSDSTISEMLERVGLDQCHLGTDGILLKKHPLTQFDFSAVAKGYGVDRVAAMLLRNGVENFMVEIGGEIRLQGYNPQGQPWSIQIDAPASDPSAHENLTVRRFGPEPTAIASSGNYRNFRTGADGRRYGHTISPKTGRPYQSDVIGATVITDGDCALADALATACMAQPSADAYAMLRNAGVEGVIVTGTFETPEIINVGTAE